MKRCPVHDGQVHGGEAEELRHGLEHLLANDSVTPRQVQALLDRVDARDSLAHGELTAAIDALTEWANPISRDLGALGGLDTIRRTMEDERAMLARIRKAVESVRGRYQHPDELEAAVFAAFDQIANEFDRGQW